MYVYMCRQKKIGCKMDDHSFTIHFKQWGYGLEEGNVGSTGVRGVGGQGVGYHLAAGGGTLRLYGAGSNNYDRY